MTVCSYHVTYTFQSESTLYSITGLATTTALNTVKNNTPNVSALVKKEDHDAEISEVKKKYLTTSDYNKFINNILDAEITEKS